jgi:hypothetical protein
MASRQSPDADREYHQIQGPDRVGYAFWSSSADASSVGRGTCVAPCPQPDKPVTMQPFPSGMRTLFQRVIAQSLGMPEGGMRKRVRIGWRDAMRALPNGSRTSDAISNSGNDASSARTEFGQEAISLNGSILPPEQTWSLDTCDEFDGPNIDSSPWPGSGADVPERSGVCYDNARSIRSSNGIMIMDTWDTSKCPFVPGRSRREVFRDS